MSRLLANSPRLLDRDALMTILFAAWNGDRVSVATASTALGLTNESVAAPPRVVGTQSNVSLAHYSPAIVVDRIVYCSGSLGIDPQTGELVGGGIQAQTRRALLNLDQLLAETG